jgi:hypothetical protein
MEDLSRAGLLMMEMRGKGLAVNAAIRRRWRKEDDDAKREKRSSYKGM